MGEEKRENLPEKKNEVKTEDIVTDTPKEGEDGEEGKESIDTSAHIKKPEPTESSDEVKDESQTLKGESESLGVTPSEKENVIEEGDGRVATAWKFDDKMKEDIRELLQSDLSNSVQDVKKDFLIIFGLFASFVTFISINVQVFKNNDNTFELLGICSISLSFIIIFTSIINRIVKNIDYWKDMLKPTFILGVVFLVLGLIFLTTGSSKDSEIIFQLEQKIALDSTQIRLLQTDIKTLNDKVMYTDSTVFNLQTRIGTVQKKQQSIKEMDNPKPLIEDKRLIKKE